MQKILVFTVSAILLSAASLLPQGKECNWQRLGGKWEVRESAAREINAFATPWNYYYILGRNTILSLRDFNDYNAIEFTAMMFGREKSPVELTVSFAVRSDFKSWYYHMYGLRFTGGFWCMDTVELIHSDRQDKSLPYNIKSNRFVNVLASGECRIKYGSAYNYRIAFEGDYINLYINGEKIFAAKRPVDDISGRIAISSANAKLTIDKVRIFKDNHILFEDDFNIDSIYVKKINATLEKRQKDDSNNPQ